MSTDISYPKAPKPNERGNPLARLTVKQRLNLVTAVMIAGILAVSIIALGGMIALSFHLTNIFDFSLTPVKTMTHTETLLADIQIHLEALHNSDLAPEEQSAHFAALEEAESTVLVDIEQYRTEWLTTTRPEFTDILRKEGKLELQQDEVTTLTNLIGSFDDFITINDQFQQEISQGTYNQEMADATEKALNETRNHLRHLVELNNEFSLLSNEVAAKSYQTNMLILFFALLVAGGAGIGLSSSTTKFISERLNILEYTAIAMEDGYMDRRTYFAISGDDEIAKLANILSRLFKRLQETLAGLEERVNERTVSLTTATKESEKRARQFEAITLVGSAIASIRSLDELLPKITELISQQFGYYHTGIFLNDANNENTILSAANSEGGQRMLTRGHQLKIGTQGIVGYVTGTGKPRIAFDVGEDAVYFDNPDMPETRSELALPLKISGSVIGALDVQSQEASAFTEEDIDVLTLLADQVSMAIENARLFDQSAKSVAESEALYRQYIRQAWGRLPKEQDLAGFQYSIRGTVPLKTGDSASNLIATAPDMETESLGDGSPRISVPISIRGETIGMLSVRVPKSKVLNEDQKDLVSAVAERVALSAENARLFEETNRRAERERLVSDITVKIRSTNDPDTMIRTALSELKTALGATHVELVPHTLQKSVASQEPITQRTETSTNRNKES